MQTYTHYKESGIDWIGQIPEHWNEIKIKNLFTEPTSKFIDGDWIESKDINSSEIYYFTTGNIQELKFKETEKSFISIETFKKLNCTEVLDGDILVSRLNVPLGRCCIFTGYDKKSIVSVDVVIFRPDEFYNRKYLVYVMNSPLYFSNTENIARGAIMKRISRTILGNIKIPIPPIHEQEAIANFLDDKTAKIDALVQTKVQQIEKLKELRQAKIHQAVTKGLDASAPIKDSGIEWIGEIPAHWEVKRLKHIKKVIRNAFVDGPFGSNLKSEHFVENGDVFVIESGSITKGYFISTNFKTITQEHFNTISRSECIEGDLIIAKIGAYYGMCAELPPLLKRSVVSGNSLKLTLNNLIANTQFYIYLLNDIRINDIYNKLGIVNSSAQPALSLGTLNNLNIIFPPIQEQEQIVAYLDEVTGKIDQAIVQKQEQITKLKEYKQSLINDVVTGKVKVF